MNKEWDLSPLYKGFDDPKFAADFEAWQAVSAQYRALPEQAESMDAGAFLHHAMEVMEKYSDFGRRLGSFASLRSATNTKDVEAISAMAKIQKSFSDCSAAGAFFDSYVGKLETLDELIAADPFLQEYTYRLHRIQENAKYTLDDKVEEAIEGCRAYAQLTKEGGRA